MNIQLNYGPAFFSLAFIVTGMLCAIVYLDYQDKVGLFKRRRRPRHH